MADSVRASVDRLWRASREWPPGTTRVARAYLRGHWPRSGAATEPYWLLLPKWLHTTADPDARRRLRPGFLKDVCWGQYCLFLCIRIQDDLFDAQAADLRLIFVADQLLVESQRAFEPHVPDGFWPIYRNMLQTTIAAILDADERQRVGTSTRDGLGVHARVSSIFKAGAAAVCLATGRSRAFNRVAVFADELAIVSQVLDDLRDLIQDLERGRLNSVGALLVGSKTGTRPGPKLLRAAGTSLIFGDGAHRLIAALQECHARARAAIRPLRLKTADTYLEGVEKNIDRLAAALHRARVEARLGGVTHVKHGRAEGPTSHERRRE